MQNLTSRPKTHLIMSYVLPSTPNQTRYIVSGDKRPLKASKPKGDFRTEMINSGLDFLSNGLLDLSKNLNETKFREIPNGTIDWVPYVYPSNYVPEPKGLGSNNVHYVVPKIKGVLGGRTIQGKRLDWEGVEKIAEQLWGLETTGTDPTRPIDYVRHIPYRNIEISQFCEIKKTTGSYDKPPTFIRSSKSQLEALCSIEGGHYETQLYPSIYIVGSCDFHQPRREWVITWWFIPCKTTDDFLVFNTSAFDWKPEGTLENDGFIV